MDGLSILEEWYSRQCNGEWEHAFGLEIFTVDNSGWSTTIDLHDTPKQEAAFARVKMDRGHDDWIHYWAEKQKFQIRCGPLNLSESIAIFVKWFCLTLIVGARAASSY